jgi:hypothetical protein
MNRISLLHAIFVILIILPLAAFADEIHLKDGSIIKGKIIQITPGTIEFDPDGDRPFDVISRDLVDKIKYDDGKIINLAGEKTSTEKKDGGTREHDEIHLNDGSIVRGEILEVLPKYIRYKKIGTDAEDLYPRDRVVRIIYRDGKTIDLAEKPKDKTEGKNGKADGNKHQKTLPNSFWELELGWNGYVGAGLRFDYRFAGPVSGNIGIGYGFWGYRLSAALRCYINYPFGAAFEAGVAQNSGSGKELEQTMETKDSNGNVIKEKVYYKMKPVTSINASFIYSWRVGGADKIYIELGYCHPVQKDNYTYRTASGNELTDKSKDVILFMYPGGIIISFGYGISY